MNEEISNQNITNPEQLTTIPAVVENDISPTSDKEEGNSFGKFKTALELKTAYEKLEQEFTRKSQRLKELESQLSEKSEKEIWSERVSAFQKKYPVSLSLGEEIANTFKENKGLIASDNCLESALLQVLARKYEGERSRGDTRKVTDNIPFLKEGGAVSVATARPPQTVQEANALATERLKKLSENN